jgi:predicted MFS family arabinose efflux permease
MIKLKKDQIALCCISLAWFLILSGRYSISNLLPQISNELNFSWTEAGFALTLMWLFYAMMQFPSGIFSDIKGRKISIIFAMALFTLSYFIVGISNHYFTFLLALIVLGIGTGSYPSAGISMITDIFRENKGKALGIRSSAGSLAYAVPLFAAAIASYLIWRTFFFIWGAVCIFSIFLFYKGTSETTTLPEVFSIKERVVDGVKVFKRKKVQLIFIVNLLIAIAWISYMSFFQPYLSTEKGMTPLVAGVAFLFLGVCGFIFKPFIGSYSDKFNKKIIIMLLSLATAAGTLIFVFAESVWLIFLILPVLSLSTAIFPIISSYLMDQWEEKGRAGKLGFYRSLLIMLSSPIATYFGSVRDEFGSFNFAFITISVILFIAVLFLIINLIYDRYKNNKNPN